MTREEIVETLTPIFRKTFNNDSLVLTETLSASDVDTWDSLTHMLMITEVEETLNIKFKLKELNKLKQVGDLISVIQYKF